MTRETRPRSTVARMLAILAIPLTLSVAAPAHAEEAAAFVAELKRIAADHRTDPNRMLREAYHATKTRASAGETFIESRELFTKLLESLETLETGETHGLERIEPYRKLEGGLLIERDAYRSPSGISHDLLLRGKQVSLRARIDEPIADVLARDDYPPGTALAAVIELARDDPRYSRLQRALTHFRELEIHYGPIGDRWIGSYHGFTARFLYWLDKDDDRAGYTRRFTVGSLLDEPELRYILENVDWDSDSIVEYDRPFAPEDRLFLLRGAGGSGWSTADISSALLFFERRLPEQTERATRWRLVPLARDTEISEVDTDATRVFVHPDFPVDRLEVLSRFRSAEALTITRQRPIPQAVEDWIPQSFLEKLPLESLAPSEDGTLTAGQLAVITSMPKLRSLELSGMAVDSTHLATVARISGLRCLRLDQLQGLNDDDLQLLSPLGDLEKLTLRMCDGVTLEGVERLLAKLGGRWTRR